VQSFFPEYDEANVILGGSVVNKIVKFTLGLVGEIDTENELIYQASDKLVYILDQVSINHNLVFTNLNLSFKIVF
jgi:hypothetical protein